jgi:hypothetical protein
MPWRISSLVVICLAGCLASTISARADQFQLLDRATREPIGFTKLGVGGHTFYTDKLGRVSINLPRGGYTVEVTYKGTARTVPIQVDGAQVLKTIDLD